jgi:hypothetical protein
MPIRLLPDEALEKTFRRDWWLILKIPVAAYLAWSFFLPQLWKVAVLLVTGVASAFMVYSPISHEVSAFHLYVMLASLMAVIYLIFWYVVYVFAYLAGPGIWSRGVGILGVLLFPVVVIGVALLIGGIGAFLRVPQDRLWAHLDKWTPISAWRTSQPSRPSSRDLDDAVRGDRPMALWQTFDGDFKHVQCLHHKVSVMRRRVGAAADPAELVSYYPTWLEELGDCARLYKVDPKRAESLHEALATEMAKVLGEETTSYLTMRRLFAPGPTSGAAARGDWIDMWRSTALVGVAGTADVLEPPK